MECRKWVQDESSLGTVKRFKGLEADIVIVWGLPAFESNELEEVLYVGSSRAKSELIIVTGLESKAILG